MKKMDTRKVIIMAVITFILSAYAYGLFIKFTDRLPNQVEHDVAADLTLLADPDNPFEIMSDSHRERYNSKKLTVVTYQASSR